MVYTQMSVCVYICSWERVKFRGISLSLLVLIKNSHSSDRVSDTYLLRKQTWRISTLNDTLNSTAKLIFHSYPYLLIVVEKKYLDLQSGWQNHSISRSSIREYGWISLSLFFAKDSWEPGKVQKLMCSEYKCKFQIISLLRNNSSLSTNIPVLFLFFWWRPIGQEFELLGKIPSGRKWRNCEKWIIFTHCSGTC